MERAWAWREKYGGMIINQLKRLGCSCDWDRERFTMDDAYTRAVYEAFVRLYEKGLIYRGHRLVNWCPKSRSAISDEEVVHRELQGKLWYFRYPIVDSNEHIVVATTRPETMLGDTAVAINPDDPRYRHLVGKKILLPLVHREMPIITDHHVDPEFGTGCVKVTPAHDPNDFAMGEAHDLKFINIMHPDATLNEHVPEPYRGLTREDARKQVVADLEAAGLLEKVEPHVHKVGYSQRGDVPIEYYMSEQWFMHMKQLVKPALEVVLAGKIRITPEHWVKTYQHWLENIQDWCISRQLWWGQRIPVWYRKGEDRSDPANRHVSIDGPADPENWEQDEDVLDTWASSWLWPFAVHEWPEEGPSLSKYYPTDVLVTGPDILFFWVARMVMAGLEFMDDVPFTDVYLHGIVRDERGRKMSKSLGNFIDPLEIIEKYSADALRFSLIMLTATGQDVYVSDEKFEIGRNFGTKIWNAARFMKMHGEEPPEGALDPDFAAQTLTPDDQHILARLHETIAACEESLERFRFNDMAKALYEFAWHEFCDRYVEYAKDALYGDDQSRKQDVLRIMHYCLAHALKLLHPIMPFLTEELWHGMGYVGAEQSIMRAAWPEARDEQGLSAWGIAQDDIRYVEGKHDLIRVARTLRADYGLSPAQKIDYVIKPAGPAAAERLRADVAGIAALARAGAIRIETDFDPSSAVPSGLSALGTVYMPLEGVVDVEAEIEKLLSQLAKLDDDLLKVARKLDNEDFVSKAPARVVDQQRARRKALLEQRGKVEKLRDALVAQQG
jgi:valyl-tRNA synthetase